MKIEKNGARLPRRRVGSTNLKLTVLGLGGAYLGLRRDRDTSPQERGAIASKTIRKALEVGINYIDTSPLYQSGMSERSVGIALSELDSEERKSFHVSTKVGTRAGTEGCYDAASVRASLEKSRTAIGRDFIDIVYVHDPESEKHMKEILCSGGAADTILEQKYEGRVGALGLGVRAHKWQKRCIKDGRFDVVLLPYDYSIARDTARPLIELAQEHEVGVVNASPYLRGLLAGPPPKIQAQYGFQEPADVERAVAIYDWCQHKRISVGAMAIQFSALNVSITSTIVGSRNSMEIATSCCHLTTTLPKNIWQEFAIVSEMFPIAAPGGESGILR